MFQEKGHTKLENHIPYKLQEAEWSNRNHNSAWMADIVHELTYELCYYVILLLEAVHIYSKYPIMKMIYTCYLIW